MTVMSSSSPGTFPVRIPACSRILPSALALVLGAALPLFGGPALIPAASLPVSIRNEADVAMENGRQFLETRQDSSGLWTLDDGRRTSLPAFAFLSASGIHAIPSPPLLAAARAALVRLSGAPFPDSPESGDTLREDALVVAATIALFGEEWIPPDAPAWLGTLSAARMRLFHLRRPESLDGSDAPSDWLALCAMELLPGPPDAVPDWAPLFRRIAHVAFPRVRDVAIAGQARLRHGAGADKPPAILAHLRWLVAHDPLLGEDFGATVSPEDLYFEALFFDAAPPALLETAGIPANWRVRFAQRLVSTARAMGSAGAAWPGATDEETLLRTVYAVSLLAALAE